MKNYIQRGEAITYTVPAETTIAAGDVVAIGNLTGVAVTGGTAGSQIVVNLVGCYNLAKTTNLTITQGDRLFWNSGTKRVTKTITDRPIGTAFEGASLNATSVVVAIYEEGVRFQPGAAEADLAGGANAAAIVVTVNSLLAKLRTAGIIAS